MDINLPQLDTLVKTLIEHDERMAQLLQQIVHQFAAVVATVGSQKGQPTGAHAPEAVTPEGQQYLRDNLDVARNPDFFDRPRAHYEQHGRAEGRSWPGGTQTFPAGRVPEQANVPTVTSPGGRTFPAPDDRENGMGYIQRVGTFLGKEAEWARRGGELMLGTDHLVPKNVKYPDDYATWKGDLKNWPTLAENFWFPAPKAADPGWQGVYDKLRERGVEVQPVDPTFAGTFGADSISDDEAAYVYGFTHTQAGSALSNKVYWESGIFGGPRVAISRLINRGEQKWNEMHLTAGEAITRWPESALKQAVLATAGPVQLELPFGETPL